ncbi:MAG: hypothetical protein WKG07_34970 [Hymenobacter sp.]
MRFSLGLLAAFGLLACTSLTSGEHNYGGPKPGANPGCGLSQNLRDGPQGAATTPPTSNWAPAPGCLLTP